MKKERREVSRTISFRIDPVLEETLRKNAAQSDLSLSAYVIESLRREIHRSPRFYRFDFLHIGRDELAAFLQDISHDRLHTVAREIGAQRLRDIFYGLYGSSDMEVLRKRMEDLVKFEYSWHTSFQRFENDGEQFVLRHGICREWSLYMGEVLKSYVEQLGFEAKYEITSNSTILRISPK